MVRKQNLSGFLIYLWYDASMAKRGRPEGTGQGATYPRHVRIRMQGDLYRELKREARVMDKKNVSATIRRLLRKSLGI